MTDPRLPVGEDDIAAFVDGRIEPGRRELVEAVLDAQPALAARVKADREIRAALRARLDLKADEPVPSRLRVATIAAGLRRRRVRWAAMAAAACLCAAFGGVAGWVGRDLVSGQERPAGPWAVTGRAALSAHRTFVGESVHPVEVKATEGAHLTQWLSRRLRRQIVVPDLDRFGFGLVGGRLLPAGPDVAAMLMFADASGARLTMYVRCGETGTGAMRLMREDGLSSYVWTEGGYGFAVSAAMGQDRLLNVAQAVSSEVRDTGAPGRTF